MIYKRDAYYGPGSGWHVRIRRQVFSERRACGGEKYRDMPYSELIASLEKLNELVRNRKVY